MSFKDLVQKRRSHRKFTDEAVQESDLKTILRAALMSPTSKARRSWHFTVVDDTVAIGKMASAKLMGAQFLEGVPVAIVVTGNPEENECWVEDGSVALISMQYQAEELGLGSCWVQMRGHKNSEGISSNDVIHGIINLPEEQQVLAVLALGHPADERKLQDEDRLKWENVHTGKW